MLAHPPHSWRNHMFFEMTWLMTHGLPLTSDRFLKRSQFMMMLRQREQASGLMPNLRLMESTKWATSSLFMNSAQCKIMSFTPASTWVMTDVPMGHITQPWMVYGLFYGYYKVMSKPLGTVKVYGYYNRTFPKWDRKTNPWGMQQECVWCLATGWNPDRRTLLPSKPWPKTALSVGLWV